MTITPQPLAVTMMASAPALDRRPPRVDVAARDRPALVLLVEVIGQRAAAPAAGDRLRADADAVEDARHRGVDRRRERRLHAAAQDHHPARVPCRRPRAGGRDLRHLARERLGQQAPRHAPEHHRRSEQRRRAQALARSRSGSRARSALRGTWPRRRGARCRPAARTRRPRAGGLARAAGEAPVEVRARLLGRALAFQHLLDQVDAAARPVELVAEQLVGRARRGAEAAVDALAENRVGFAPLGRVPDECGEIGLHQNEA